jgi:hypothetical protein
MIHLMIQSQAWLGLMFESMIAKIGFTIKCLIRFYFIFKGTQQRPRYMHNLRLFDWLKFIPCFIPLSKVVKLMKLVQILQILSSIGV